MRTDQAKGATCSHDLRGNGLIGRNIALVWGELADTFGMAECVVGNAIVVLSTALASLRGV